MSSDPLTDLLGAAETGDAARVVELIERHPEVINTRGHLRNHTGLRTALHFGIDHEPVVRALLEHGADPNIRDEGDNAMPLHFAAERQDFPVIRLLIEHGADPIGAGDGHALEVIGWSCCWDYVETNRELIDYLLAHGARHHIFSAVTVGGVDAIRALIATAPTDHTWRACARSLQEDPSLAKAVNDNGITPLWWLPDDERAAVEVVSLLLAHGADAGTGSRRAAAPSRIGPRSAASTRPRDCCGNMPRGPTPSHTPPVSRSAAR